MDVQVDHEGMIGEKKAKIKGCAFEIVFATDTPSNLKNRGPWGGVNGEIFDTLTEARVLIEAYRKHYNRERPHSSLGSRPPAPEAIPGPPISIASRLGMCEQPWGQVRINQT